MAIGVVLEMLLHFLINANDFVLNQFHYKNNYHLDGVRKILISFDIELDTIFIDSK